MHSSTYGPESKSKRCPPLLIDQFGCLGNPPLVTITAAVRDGYVQFLNQWDWEWYFTLTFCEDVHPEQADKLFNKWIRILSKKYYGAKYYKRNQFIDWVRSSEYQKRGALHYHGLLNAPDKFNQFEAMKTWENLDVDFMVEGKTGMAIIYKADQPAAEIYITKYVSKETNVDISENLKTDFSEIHRQGSLNIAKQSFKDNQC